MKVDGITLLQMINDRTINKKTKIYIDYKVTHKRERMENEIEYLIYENGNLFTNGNRVKIWDCMGIEYFLEHNFKIIEEEENKPIQKIFGLHHPSTESLDLIKEDVELTFATIDKLIDEVNKLKKEKENE